MSVKFKISKIFFGDATGASKRGTNKTCPPNIQFGADWRCSYSEYTKGKKPIFERKLRRSDRGTIKKREPWNPPKEGWQCLSVDTGYKGYEFN
jgi:hypothetical protein